MSEYSAWFECQNGNPVSYKRAVRLLDQCDG